MKDLYPTDDRILVEKMSDDNKTAGGLFVPDAAMTRNQLGTVLALGPKVTTSDDADTVIKVGSVILFANFSGIEVIYEGKKYLMFNQKDVLAVVHSVSLIN